MRWLFQIDLIHRQFMTDPSFCGQQSSQSEMTNRLFMCFCDACRPAAENPLRQTQLGPDICQAIRGAREEKSRCVFLRTGCAVRHSARHVQQAQLIL